MAVFNEWLWSQKQEVFEEITSMDAKTREKADEEDFDMGHFLTSASDLFSAWLKEHGLWFEDDTIYYDPDHFGVIALEAACVMADYDFDAEILAKGDYSTSAEDYEYKDGRQASKKTPWNRWNLGGDDDVDYNGGYITMALDALIVYEREHAK